MSKPIIYAIGRQYGSGGREIGKKLADSLGIPFYDKELLLMISEENGMDSKILENADEKVDYSFYYLNAIGYTIGAATSGFQDISLNDKLFIEQTKLIRKIADEGSCVIVGRCADYILSDYANVVSIFIHATIEDRVKRVDEEYDVECADIESYITKIDKRRANYYNYYTDRKWARSDSYDLTLNSSKFTIDGCIKLLKDLAE